MKPPYDPEQMQEVATRYESRQSQLPRSRELAPAPVPPSTERRKVWLAESLSTERAEKTVAEAEARGATENREETLESLARERIIGSSDLRDMNYLELAIAVSRAVCRIRIGSMSGTGSLVGPRVLMTNNHVIETVEDARQAEAQFDYQENMSGELLPVQVYRFNPDLLFITDPALDFTLVGLASESTKGTPLDRYPWLQLLGNLGKADKDDPLNIIQHPRGGLKQIALRNNLIIDIPEGGKPDFLYYTTDTEPGSSGAPCFNDQWELVALHHSGVPRRKNGQILKKDGTPWRNGLDDPLLIDWLANEGARVSAMVSVVRGAPLAGAAADLRDQLLSQKPPNPIELARGAASGGPLMNGGGMNTVGSAAQIGAGAGNAVTFSIPLTIALTLGGPGNPVAAGQGPTGGIQPTANRPGVTTSADDLATEALKVDPDWGTRKGYDPTFLGTSIPLPTLSAAMAASTVEVPAEFRLAGNKHVLPYHHYSLAMNKDRRFAWYSAANIDGDHRPKLPKRENDRWHVDPRIDDPEAPIFQCGEDLYATAKTDRGHLTRYLDVAWGTEGEALNAVADSFHFTNACLQLSDFNQGKERWQGIEQFLLEKKTRAEKRRIVVITGPIFKATDPVYKNPVMDAAVRIPLAFWKVCAIIRPDDSLAATAFVMDQQDVVDLPGFEEAFNVLPTQRTIAEIEALTGLTFPVLRDHDHFAQGGAPGTLEIDIPGGGTRQILPLRSYEDIVV